MSTGWNGSRHRPLRVRIINLLGNEYWLEPSALMRGDFADYKPTGK